MIPFFIFLDYNYVIQYNWHLWQNICKYSNTFSDMSVLQTGLSSLNDDVFENYTGLNDFKHTTKNTFTTFSDKLDNFQIHCR